MDKPPQKPEEERFYVTVSNAVQGPYDLDFIEAMVLSGIYPPGVPVCREGSEEWKALEGVRPADLPPEPVKAAPAPIRATPMPSTNNNSRNVLIVAGIVIFIVILLAVNNSSSTGGSAQSATPAYSPPQAAGGIAPRNSVVDAWNKDQSEADTWRRLRDAERQAQSLSVAAIRDKSHALGTLPFGNDTPSALATPDFPQSQEGSASPTPAHSFVKFGGKTYRVSNSDYWALQRRQDEMAPKGRALEASQSRAKELGDEIERERASLDNTDQAAVDRFNEKVDRYNTLHGDVEQQLTEYNALVDAYNAELVRVGTPVQ